MYFVCYDFKGARMNEQFLQLTKNALECEALVLVLLLRMN